MIPFDLNPFSKKYYPRTLAKQQEIFSQKNWIKCPECGILVYENQLRENQNICPKCEHLFRLDSLERIRMIFDENTFTEIAQEIKPQDVLQFVDRKTYATRLQETIQKTGIQEAIRVGVGKIDTIPVAAGLMDFQFIGGSMGMVVGEKIVKIVEYAMLHSLPLVIFSSSGGARMQEGMYSLIQMARTSAVIGKYQKQGGFFVSVLTDPTTGGVSASFAFLGDIILAEPKALIGFAGPRVIEQTTRQKLPPGFQTAEFLLEHGQIDKIIKRKQIKHTLSTLFQFYQKGKQA